MNSEYPTYTKIFEEAKTILKEIRKEYSQDRKTSDVDDLMFYLAGNINLRLNTIFHLLENNITDGVLPLQRTLFELQIAFDALTNAENKDKKTYVKFFNKKHGFETAHKLDRFFKNDSKESKNIATPEEIEELSQIKDAALGEIKSEQLQGGNPQFKQWYELASGKRLTNLCVELQEIGYYYQCYDEPSNWVHPQRIIENMDVETFSQQMPSHFNTLINGNLYWGIIKLIENIAFLANYYNVGKNNLLYKYISDHLDKLVELGEELKLLLAKEA
ncbi:DUF5677 domain-containing protein [Bacillus thuringiensis]|uniref:Uncharacterized protein n=1 Tax=Bacillus thuringiensis subsp. kurstaki TaxID=29339 RepID=Q3YN25_BACTK|nr:MULTISPECIES: DUF5677 domain-containing protein [Bacillus cereus group]MEB9963586.1 DUF5677 domain-containing protein [Bacillus cereus]AAZ06619.1 hypothetical protein pAW63_050 [Bacillus thuringiensis serovar kurstaki]AGE81697.1 hypothetical protein HD73_7550 [Bacillus thuringiensis serovar kurstaki str. HD73]AND11277.1 hypothetical protein Bt4C1_28895 [Bacillus thuringiensis serovar alesti]EJV73209.1 hypothetical protein IG1_05867 [Bacillus cereus HD73]